MRLRARWILAGAQIARRARETELPPLLTAIEVLAVTLTGRTPS
ncbi:hypothetical protein [Streptomyces carpinensis]|uniref:Uncharacterized protein n=1 Tax=Streptomyces carpinensis TaxID=66369 RepID=A0ABV1WGQ9_9ACTN|nr:hypothetical protein [Streptomyces carpinensis]